MLNLIPAWFSRWRSQTQRQHATNIVLAATAELRLPVIHTKPNIWSVVEEPCHGYPLRLDLAVQDELILCLLILDIHAYRPWVSQRLAVTLLEANTAYTYGSNRLVDRPSGMSIVHCHVCDSRLWDANHVAQVGRTVLKQMRELVSRLYAEELIPSTAELAQSGHAD